MFMHFALEEKALMMWLKGGGDSFRTSCELFSPHTKKISRADSHLFAPAPFSHLKKPPLVRLEYDKKNAV